MNKSIFLNKLKDKLGYNEEQCVIIVNILESHFIVGKNNKKKIIDDLILNSFSEDDAENIYDISMSIIMSELKNKFKHPFKSIK